MKVECIKKCIVQTKCVVFRMPQIKCSRRNACESVPLVSSRSILLGTTRHGIQYSGADWRTLSCLDLSPS